jgi:signal transduction histidine kinase
MITADFHPDGRHVVCGDEEEWYLGDTMTGRILHREPSPRLRSVLFSRGGDHIIRSGGAGLAAVRCEIAHANVSLSPIQLDPRVSSQRWLERAVFSPDGKYLLAVGADKGFVLDGNSLRPEFEFGQGYDLLAFAAISPDARWVVASTWKGVGVCVWNRETQTFLRSLIRESSHVDFDPSGRWLATSNHRGFQLWRTEDWTLHRTSEVDTGSYTPGPARFCPRGSLLAVAPGRNTIHLVEPESGKIALSLLSPDAINLTWLAFSRDGAQLAAATEQSDVHIWNLANIRTALQSLSLESEKVFSEMSTSTRTFNGPTAGTPSGRLAIGLIVGGMLLAVFFGVYSLVQQHRQMRNYVHIEELAEEQNHHLIAAELELQQSQKMKALGTLAAGVAHDFNNLLSVISLSNGFLKRGVRQDTSLAEETEAIDKAVKQGRQVVESMLGYSRGDQDSVPQSINLCELVEDSVGLLGQQFLSGIRLTMELDRRAPCVKARKGRLEQILLNLIVNAGEAMGAGGRLDIRVAARHRSELRTCVLAPAESPGYVELVVRDDGPGIAPDVLNRVFEPFFSTKTRGARQGTGLGLSMVYTLSSQEGYGVDVESTPGKGACFWIVIPTAPARQSLSSQSTNAD